MRRVRFGLLCRSLYRDQYASRLFRLFLLIPCWESQRLIPKRSAGPRATKIGVASLKRLTTTARIEKLVGRLVRARIRTRINGVRWGIRPVGLPFAGVKGAALQVDGAIDCRNARASSDEARTARAV